MPHSRYTDTRLLDHGNPAANCLHERFREVIEKWEARARAYLPAANDKSHEELTDSLPYFLHGLIEALSVNGEDIETGEAGHTFRRHGVQRTTLSNFSLHQLITEYFLLRDVLFEVLEGADVLGRRERDIILRSVDFGLKEACAEFAHIRLAEVKTSLLQMERTHQKDLHTLESIVDPFGAFDFEGRFLFMNDAAEKALGCLKEEVLERSLWDVLPEPLSTQLREACQTAMREHVTSTFDIENANGSGAFKARIYPSKDGFSLYFQEIDAPVEVRHGGKSSQVSARRSTKHH